ncbi:MAG: MMPL family transporter, partial [Ilumatobacter sp.]|uniref:MMPL family transporter n=1 Tax=Ilumatobacter sp. TaxID=1967498 RepID=UPI00261BB2DC
MKADSSLRPNRFERLIRRPAPFLGLLAVVTGLLAIPLVALAPDESASTEPSGPVFTARDRVDDTFVSTSHGVGFIIEDDEGDILRAEPLRELAAASERLRTDPEIGPTLLTYFDTESRQDITGILTMADLIDDELSGGLAAATDADVKAAGADLIERFGERSSILAISAASTRAPNGDWIIPALNPAVVSDDEVLGFGNTSITLGGDTDVEEYDRDVQEILRTAEGLSVWGIAIDVNLTSQEQGAIAGPFIGFTILAVLVVIGLTFRSYWVLATVSAALIALIVWLKGISNLIGLKDDLVLSLIVPIAMISFGVDFAFHALGRYREERAEGRRAERAFVVGGAAVSGALVLALTSDAAAFLSNVSAGIESIIQFGVGAAIALAAAYLLLGIATPLAVAAIEARVPEPRPGRRATALRLAGGLGAGMMGMASVLLTVFILPAVGAVVAALTVFVTVVVPFLVQRRKAGERVGDVPVVDTHDRMAKPIGATVGRLARRPGAVIGSAVVLTGVAAVFAVQVPAAFD